METIVSDEFALGKKAPAGDGEFFSGFFEVTVRGIRVMKAFQERQGVGVGGAIANRGEDGMIAKTRFLNQTSEKGTKVLLGKAVERGLMNRGNHERGGPRFSGSEKTGSCPPGWRGLHRKTRRRLR